MSNVLAFNFSVIFKHEVRSANGLKDSLAKQVVTSVSPLDAFLVFWYSGVQVFFPFSFEAFLYFNLL